MLKSRPRQGTARPFQSVVSHPNVRSGPAPVSSRFAPASKETKSRVVLSLERLTKHGGTHFACTAPDPIGYISFDNNAEITVAKFIKGFDGQKPKKIDYADYRQEISLRDEQQVAKETLRAFEADYQLALDKYATVVVDTGTEMYELVRLAELGRLQQVPPNLYGPVNSQMRKLLRMAKDGNANVVFIHKLKPKWINETAFNERKGQIENKSKKTDELIRAGWGDIGFQVHANLYLWREDKQDGGSEFFAQILDSTHDPALNGTILEGESVNFPTVASMLTGTDLDDWS